MKRLLRTIPIIIMFLLIAAPALAYSYITNIEVQETNGTDYSNMTIKFSIDNEELADAHFIESDALDTRILRAGLIETPHMVTLDRVNFYAWTISGDSTNNFSYTFGDTDLTSMYIIPGYNGYITITDAAALEPSDDFEFEFDDGYFDTSAGGHVYFYKTQACKLYSAASGEITFGIDETDETPNSHADPDAQWSNETNAYDDNTGTPSDSSSEVSYLELIPTAPIVTDAVRIYACDWDVGCNNADLDIDVYDGTSWTNIHSGNITMGMWNTITFTPQYVTEARIKGNQNGFTHRIYEFDFFVDDLSVTATGFTSDSYDVIANADGSDLKIYIDASEEDSAALGGASIPDNGNDWILMSNSIPYLGYYKHTVNSTLIAWYQPITMIDGTTLPDREGAAQNGAFTFGSNPAGIGVTVGSAVPAQQINPVPTIDTDPEDIIVHGGNFDPNAYALPEAGTVVRYAYDFLAAILTGIDYDVPVMVIINIFACIIVLAVMVFMAVLLPNHHLIVFISGLAVVGAFIGIRFLPIDTVISFTILGITLLILERKPVF